ncbi:MAG: hypothetical protein ACLS3V_01240 [Streptococcus sp.]
MELSTQMLLFDAIQKGSF